MRSAGARPDPDLLYPCRMSTPDYSAIVIGAGVVGLATAAALPGAVLVVERHDGICREASSRNSEVIHAGIYYPAGSLKARTCVRGRELLYRRCIARGVPHAQSGKLIVAETESDRGALETLRRGGEANGVPGLRILDGAELRAMEPHVGGVAALWSPASGYLDTHAYAETFVRDIERDAGDVVFRTEVVGIDRGPDGVYAITVRTGAQEHTLTAARVVNAAGLGQDAVSALAGIDVDAAGYRTHPCKGCWWTIAPRHRGRVAALVYPVGRAEDPGLGIHLCLDVGGGMRLGPDVAFVDDPGDLAVPLEGRDRFFAAGRRLFPWLEPQDLSPAMAGMRTKLVPAPNRWRDFVLREESDRGLHGWVTLAGIESPGITAASALAEEVAALLR